MSKPTSKSRGERLSKSNQPISPNPDHYKNDKSEIVGKKERLEVVKRLLEASYTRWEELEQLKKESSA